METARFTKVVEKCGQPEIYLALMAPAKDHTLQAAVKAQRIMTVWQESAGTKADRGEVGFEPGPARQYLVFPESLRAFAGRTVVGIKYDLLRSRDVPKSKQAERPRPRKDPKPKRARVHSEKPETLAAEKVVAFTPGPPEAEDEEVAYLKKQIRQAMALLEDGKAVAAFNLLKQTVSG